jgi:flagellar biosynthesis component FlhA
MADHNWGNDGEQIAMIERVSEADRRRATMMVILGVAVGATLIATFFLGVLYFQASSSLNYERAERTRLQAEQRKSEEDYRNRMEETQRRFDDLRRDYEDALLENTKLGGKRAAGLPAPRR